MHILRVKFIIIIIIIIIISNIIPYFIFVRNLVFIA